MGVTLLGRLRGLPHDDDVAVSFRYGAVVSARRRGVCVFWVSLDASLACGGGVRPYFVGSVWFSLPQTTLSTGRQLRQMLASAAEEKAAADRGDGQRAPSLSRSIEAAPPPPPPASCPSLLPAPCVCFCLT